MGSMLHKPLGKDVRGPGVAAKFVFTHLAHSRKLTITSHWGTGETAFCPCSFYGSTDYGSLKRRQGILQMDFQLTRLDVVEKRKEPLLPICG